MLSMGPSKAQKQKELVIDSFVVKFVEVNWPHVINTVLGMHAIFKGILVEIPFATFFLSKLQNM